MMFDISIKEKKMKNSYQNFKKYRYIKKFEIKLK